MPKSPPGGRRRFRSAVLEEMLAAAEAAYPQEWVGALLGDRGQIEKVVGLPNVAPDPRRSYEVEASVLLAMATENPALQLMGIAHSHPDGDSKLSAADQVEAMAGLWHIVIPVIAGRANRIGLWQI